ncbi:MAG: hypothetical protein GYA56_12195 [Geobacteraceae bacterium]|nr:hypothetical protein [Geobacteraceae bacterium]
MGLFSRTSLGISFDSWGVRCARVTGPPSAPRLETLVHRPIPSGAVRFSLREPNIVHGEAVTGALREACADLGGCGSRIFLTLPHGAGRVMLLDVEEEFRGKAEGLPILRWKLGKKLACDGEELRIDFQQIGERRGGYATVLAVVAFRRVIEQYEEVLEGAQAPPARIDFDCFNLCRLFESRLDCRDSAALLFCLDTSLGVMVFSRGVPVFLRVRERRGEQPRDPFFHTELSRSYRAFRDRFPDHALSSVLCVVSPAEAQDVLPLARGVMGCEPVMLQAADAVNSADGSPLGRERLFPFSATIGAALRGF